MRAGGVRPLSAATATRWRRTQGADAPRSPRNRPLLPVPDARTHAPLLPAHLPPAAAATTRTHSPPPRRLTVPVGEGIILNRRGRPTSRTRGREGRGPFEVGLSPLPRAPDRKRL